MSLWPYRRWRMFLWLSVLATIGVIACSVFATYRFVWVTPRLAPPGASRVLIARGAIWCIEFTGKGSIGGRMESTALREGGVIWWPRVVNKSDEGGEDFWFAIPIWVFVVPTLAGVMLGRRRARLAFPGMICRGCRYSLKGLAPGTRCPECGRVSKAAIRAERRVPRWIEKLRAFQRPGMVIGVVVVAVWALSMGWSVGCRVGTRIGSGSVAIRDGSIEVLLDRPNGLQQVNRANTGWSVRRKDFLMLDFRPQLSTTTTSCFVRLPLWLLAAVLFAPGAICVWFPVRRDESGWGDDPADAKYIAVKT